MPRRITNLCGMSSGDIDYENFSFDEDGIRTCYLCFKVNLPTLINNEEYKRALVGIVLSNITNTINVTLHNLLDHDFNNFDYEHIEWNITKTYCKLEIKTKEDLLFKYLDLMYVINDTQSQYEMYFCIKSVGNLDHSLTLASLSSDEEILFDIIDPVEYNSMHERINIDAGLAGAGSVDLINENISLCVLNINTSRNNNVSLKANYNQGVSGIFGYNVSANFEYRITQINQQYIKLRDYNNITTIFNYVSRYYASTIFGINIKSSATYIYLNFDDLSYLAYENNKLCLYSISGDKVIFHSYSNKLLVNQILTPTRTINYNIEDNKVKSIECDGDYINITYTSDLVTRIDYNYNYNIIFEYQTYGTSAKLLKKISYYKYDLKLDQDILIARAAYQYADDRLADAYDDLTKIGLHFEYSLLNNKYYIYEVITQHKDKDNEIINQMRIGCEGVLACITNELGDTNYYCLDHEGKCHLMIDSEKNHKSKQYMESPVLGGNDLLVSETNLVANARNYINNPYFKLNGSNIINWTQDFQNYAEYEACMGKNGETGIHIYNIRYYNFKLSQSLSLLTNTNYTKLYFYGNIRGSGSVYINLKINNVDDIHTFSANSIWQEISFEKDLSNISINSIEVIITISIGSNIKISNFEINDSRIKDDNLLVDTNFDNYNNNDELEGWNVYPNDTTYCISDNIPGIEYMPFSKMLEIGGSYKKFDLSQRVDISGNASDILSFSFFTQMHTYLNECIAYIKVHYLIEEEKTYDLVFSCNSDVIRKVVHNITCENAYDYVIVGIKHVSAMYIRFTNFSLCREQEANYYTYNKNKTLYESMNGEIQTSSYFDNEHKLRRSIDEYGIIRDYSYFNNGLLKQVNDENGNTLEYEYDDNNYISKSTLRLLNGNKIKIKNRNDKYGNVLISKVNENIEEAYEFDDDNRLIKISNQSGLTEHITYDNKDKIIRRDYDLEDQTIKLDYTYNNLEEIEKLKVENVEKYHYNEYDDYSSLTQIKLYNNVINTFNYYTHTSFLNDTIYTGLLSSKIYPNGTYSFTYDNKDRLSQVLYNNNLIASYYYNRFGNVTKLIDASGTLNLTYNKKNQVIKKELSNNNQNKISVSYEYDNLDSIQKKNIEVGEDNLSYDYIYDYEYNEYTQGGYFSRLETYFDDDFLFEDESLKYYNGEVNDSIKPGIINDTELSRKVFHFVECNQHLTFDCDKINNKRSDRLSSIVSFDYDAWRRNFGNNKTVLLWIKLTSFDENNNDTKIVTFASGSTEIASLAVTHDGMLKYTYDGNSHIGSQLTLNEWTMVGISLRQENSQTKVYEYYNDNHYISTYNTLKVGSITKIGFGDFLNNSSTSVSTYFDILCSIVGSHAYTTDEVVGIYKEGLKYIFSNSIHKSSGVVYYNHSIYNDLDVFSLNGSLKSNQGNRVLDCTYGDDSYKINKTKLFKLDNKKSNADTEYTNRHIYGCFGDEVTISGKPKSMLSYDLGIHQEGFISFRFKLENLGNNTSSKTLLYARDNSSVKFHMWIDASNNCIQYGAKCPNYVFKNTNLYVTNNLWHLLSITWDSSHFRIQLDNILYEDNNVAYDIDLNNSKTYIGCEYYNNAVSNALNGLIEMFTYKDSYLPLKHNTLLSGGRPISHLSKYDEVNRIINKEIITPSQRLLHEYSYDDGPITVNNENYTKIDLYPASETLEDGKQIQYTYDKAHNIILKEILQNNVVIESYNYTYDELNRLVEECYNGGTLNHHYQYTYDKNGNVLEKIVINSSDIVEEIYVYIYSNTIKDQLIRIDKCDRHYDVISSEYINYSANDPFRPSSYKGNNLVWQGRRLLSYGNNTYTYNSEGIRISKTTSSGTYTYILDGNRIIKEIKPNNINVYYHYDEKGLLVGFNYNNNEYFYVRDILGNIINILDSNGNIQASYRYNAYGKIEYIDEESIIEGINSFFYKGYYYDEETQLYYCNSRYYNPNICRWISIDEISYLDSDDINGINLWCYCGNNPVMYLDSEGKKWYHWAVGAAIIVGFGVLTFCTAGYSIPTMLTAMASIFSTTVAPSAASALCAGAFIGSALIGGVGLIMGGALNIDGWSWESASKGFMIGSIIGAIIGGSWGKVHYGMQSIGKMAINVNINTLKYDPSNPITDEGVNYWTRILSKNGFSGYNTLPNAYGDITTIDIQKGTNMILNGHHRVYVLKKYGIERINVFIKP